MLSTKIQSYYSYLQNESALLALKLESLQSEAAELQQKNKRIRSSDKKKDVQPQKKLCSCFRPQERSS